MKIFTFGAAEEPTEPGKPRPMFRFGTDEDVVGASKLAEQQQRLEDTAKRVDASITTKQRELESKFAKPLSGAELFNLMSEAHRKTAIMASSAQDLSGGYDDMKQQLVEAERKAATLLNMARLLRDQPATVPNIKAPVAPGSFWSNEFKAAAVVPYNYTKKLLHSEVAKRGTITKIVNIPSGVIEYVADQAATGAKSVVDAAGKVIGIPGWIIPVGIGAIAIAYVTNAVIQAKTLAGGKT